MKINENLFTTPPSAPDDASCKVLLERAVQEKGFGGAAVVGGAVVVRNRRRAGCGQGGAVLQAGYGGRGKG